MTPRKFFVIFLLQALVFGVLKAGFYNYFDYQDIYWIFLYWAAVSIVTVYLVRRLGIINFFEAFLVIGLWVAGDVLLDAMLTASFSSTRIFSQLYFWGGYGFMAVFIFFMHKKRHIHIRKEQRAHHHGHH